MKKSLIIFLILAAVNYLINTKTKIMMTKFSNTFVLVMALLVAVSCSNHQSADTTVTHEVAKPGKSNIKLKETTVQVPLDSAKAFIKRYDSICSKLLGIIPIRAYTIRAQDLTQVLGLPDTTTCTYDHVRVYLGMDNNNQFKLFFTPVIKASLDPRDMQAGIDVILGHIDSDPNSGYVLDLNAPCPTTCDQTSPLYNPE